MNIEDILKEYENVRLDCGRKWLVWYMDEFVVYEKIYNAKKAIIAYRGEYIEKAILHLTNSE